MMIPDLTGQQFGKYRLVRKLGEGGFASVYLGQHVLIPTQQAAIKILHLHGVDVQRFQAEATTTAQLLHPNIVRLLDFDLQAGTPFLVLDYAPQGSISERHPHGEKLQVATVVSYLKQIAQALQYAHDQHNIIHRDLKPDNILIGRQGELLLSDFGIAVLSKTGRTTLGGNYGRAGTPYYTAPEQFRGTPEKASDQYSLAVIAYEWLCGEWPFFEGNEIELAFQHLNELVPPLHQYVPELPTKVEEIILKALAKQPQDRFESVTAFAHALEQASQNQQTETVLAYPARSRQQTLHFAGCTWRFLRSFSFPRDTIIDSADDFMYDVWSPDWQMLAGGSYNARKIALCNTQNGQLLRTLEGHADEDWARNYLRDLVWSPDGQKLASLSCKTLKVWNIQTGQLLFTDNIENVSLSEIVWSPDGRILVAGNRNVGIIHRWDAQTGRDLDALGSTNAGGHTSGISSIAWSPDGRMLASGSYDRTIQLWNPRTNRVLRTLSWKHWIISVAWSPDGRILASSDEPFQEKPGIQLWDVHTGQILYTHTCASKAYSITWGPDGQSLIVEVEEDKWSLWRPQTGQTFPLPENFIEWSPDGQMLAMTPRDQEGHETIEIWERQE